MRISSPEEITDSAAQLSKDGYVILNDVFPPSLIDRLHEAYMAEYGSMSCEQMAAKCAATGPNRFLKAGDRRYHIVLTMKPPFNDPSLFANERIGLVLQQALGEGYKLSSFNVVVSHPGSRMQHIHRDHAHLFQPVGICCVLPPYAINVAIPLADLDLKSGPTGVWPGSQRWPNSASCDSSKAVSPALSRGDCMMMDLRTLHAGLPNMSDRVRPLLYIVYARAWFFDVSNFDNRNPVDFPLDEYAKLTPALQSLLSRVQMAQLRMNGME